MSVCRRHEAPRAAGIMADVTANAREVMSGSAGLTARGGRCPAPGGGVRSAETWKGHIVRELKHRDRSQHTMFQDLIRFCTSSKYKSDSFQSNQELREQQRRRRSPSDTRRSRCSELQPSSTGDR